jgi:hypothetical protein
MNDLKIRLNEDPIFPLTAEPFEDHDPELGVETFS